MASDQSDVAAVTFFVKVLSGRKREVALPCSAQVSALKGLIQESEGVNAVDQRLVFNGSQMADDQPLSHYGLQTGATVHMVMSFLG